MVGTRRGLRNIKIDQQLRLEVQLLTGPKLPAMGESSIISAVAACATKQGIAADGLTQRMLQEILKDEDFKLSKPADVKKRLKGNNEETADRLENSRS